MSIMTDLPPMIEAEVREYAVLDDMTIEQLALSRIEKEFA